MRSHEKRHTTLRGAFAALVIGISVVVPLGTSAQSPAHAESITGGLISRSEVIARAQDWYLAGLTYNSTRSPGTLVSDVDGTDMYGPDCSGMVSMAWHVNPGSSGGFNTSSLPSVATPISTNALAPGDLLDDQVDGHAILFEAWQSDHVHFSYYSFGSTPMRHYDGGTGPTEGPLGSFATGVQLAGHPASNYAAYRYNNVVEPRIGVLTSAGDVYVTEGGLGAGWVDEYNGAAQVALAGDRIAVLNTSGQLYAKDGIGSTWTLETSGVQQIALSQTRIGALTTDRHALVKEGLFGTWIDEMDNAWQLSLSGDRIGVLTNDWHAMVKQGPGQAGLGAAWVDEYYPATDIALSGDRIGIYDSTNNTAQVKQGSLGAGWSTQYNGLWQLSLSGDRIGVLTNTGEALVKEPDLGSGWSDEFGSAAQLVLS